uniref:ribosomal protein L31 n=1 Tax=Haramonas pauciplastida TaxID=478668 RepID=UPI00211466C4|nr:ribosomal protein L31 [Haramonas pauciplastida]UTE94957.1 ribosomal protein L31 [Haramonas pauciplastida]
MAKKNIHPEWFGETKVFCDGELILITSSTLSELNVDIWSGIHPFYTGSQLVMDTEGRVQRFLKRYRISTQQEKKNL